MYILLIYCELRQRKALLDEFDDWKDDGANVVLSGISNKTRQGFIFLEWNKPIPEAFRQKLHVDPDITDYIELPEGTILPPE